MEEGKVKDEGRIEGRLPISRRKKEDLTTESTNIEKIVEEL